jgi:hypothetical protein
MRNKFYLLSAVLISLVCFILGCGGGGSSSGGSTTTTTIDATGMWRGTVIETAFGTSTSTLILIQSGASVTGTYSGTYGTGSVSGSVSGSVLSCSISPTGCTGTMTGMGTVTTNSTGQQQMAFSGSGIYTCSGRT